MTTDIPFDDWHWVDVEGKRQRTNRQGLLALLGGGRLPRHALVWRKGWAQWMAACQVAELAEAFGDDMVFVQPRLDPRCMEPPALPAGSAPLHAPVTVAAGTGSPPRTGMRHGPPVTTPVPPAVRRPALRRRPAMPTLIEEEGITATGTLRPPAAVPPPPRAVPSLSQMEAVVPGPERQDLVATPAPVPRVDPLAEARVQQTPGSSEQPVSHRPSQPRRQLASTEGALPARPQGDEPKHQAATQPSFLCTTVSDAREPASFPKTESVFRGSAISDASPPDSEPQERSAGPDDPVKAGLSRALAPYVGLGILAGLLGVTAVGLWSHRRQAQTSPRPATPVVAMAKPAPPPEGPCVLARIPQRLSPAVVLNVPLNVATDPTSGNAALGFADSAAGAMGIAVDPVSLMVGHVFRETSGAPTLEVTPLAASGRLDFAVVRQDSELVLSHPVDAAQRFTVGLRGQDMERVSATGSVAVWPGVGTAKLTHPRVASVPAVGHAVTFRSGGQQGQILFGWLTDAGQAKTPLQRIAVDGLVGTPTVAANDRGVLTAFAARSTTSEPWHIELALTDFGVSPSRAVPFALPPGGPGQDAISPVAAGLPGSRWLLQWTEGPAGRRDVRVQTLTHDLDPLGAAVTVSPKGSNAGQGVVWNSGTNALAAFLVSNQTAHELWGAALRCP